MHIADLQKFLARNDLMDVGAFRKDAALSAFVDRQLTHVTAQMFEADYPEIKYRDLIPLTSEIPAGASSYAYAITDHVGEALPTDDYAADSPAADCFDRENQRRIVPIRTHFVYSVQDMRAALMSGKNLPERKAKSARMLIERGVDRLLMLGDAARGLEGLVNCSDVEADDVTGAVWGDSKDADGRVGDVSKAIEDMLDATNGVEGNSVDLLLPPKQYFMLTARVPDTGISGLAYLQQMVPNVRSIKPSPWLKGAGSDGSDRGMIYVNDPTKLQGLLPLALYSHTPEQKGMVWKTELEARCGGTVFYKPGSARYFDKI